MAALSENWSYSICKKAHVHSLTMVCAFLRHKIWRLLILYDERCRANPDLTVCIYAKTGGGGAGGGGH